ncbi:nucleotidyltransferase family protein [Neolewinella litorea]|uniref:nucleotidyltransferase family protein n=1 Tax=Neolewinella litorea TaxID=2562452 RepID=UPI001FEC03BB|nr:nucleotidyltransferase domain-containing protein [Neolewinella litorea]
MFNSGRRYKTLSCHGQKANGQSAFERFAAKGRRTVVISKQPFSCQKRYLKSYHHRQAIGAPTLTMHTLIRENIGQIAAACRKYAVKELSVFGSVLEEERFAASSDVDVYVDFDESNISLERYADYYFALHAELETILDRPVDITTKRSLKNPFFKEELNRTKQSIFQFSEKIDG